MSDLVPCPYCFKGVKPDVKFCKHCGSPVKKCPTCKSLNRENSSFCSSCGADIRDVKVEQKLPDNASVDIGNKEEEKTIAQEDKEGKLIVWPPTPQVPTYPQYPYRAHRPAIYQPFKPITEGKEQFEPKQIIHPYFKVKFFGFLSGPLPTSNVFVAVIESFAYAIALIAAGVLIIGIGLTFFQTLVLPIIGILWGGTLLLSAPFYGIYYVSSNWLYRAFSIKRTVSSLTVLWNYMLSTILFSFITLIITPFFAMGSIIGTVIAVSGMLVYLMILIVVPLKAYLADLTYVKAAVIEREKQKQKEENEEEETKVEKEESTSTEEEKQNID
ncbi:MAG: double zinc ribbon domain-containing protein [Candidatus Heimdallarchaeaceae archaeon]